MYRLRADNDKNNKQELKIFDVIKDEFAFVDDGNNGPCIGSGCGFYIAPDCNSYECYAYPILINIQVDHMVMVIMMHCNEISLQEVLTLQYKITKYFKFYLSS